MASALERRESKPEVVPIQVVSSAVAGEEVQQSCELIAEWIARRARVFKGSVVNVSYEPSSGRYNVTINYSAHAPDDWAPYTKPAQTHQALVQIDGELIVKHTTDEQAWIRFLGTVWDQLRRTLAESMRAAGHQHLELDSSGWNEDRIIDLPWRQGTPGARRAWAADYEPTNHDEQAAIESIKESWRAQAQ